MQEALITILLCTSLSMVGCRTARPGAAPAPLDDAVVAAHEESAALVCENQTPVASWQRQLIVAAPCVGGRTCEQAWEDLSRLTDQLLLFRCERICGNGELLVDGEDLAAVFEGHPLPKHSYVELDLDANGDGQLPAFVVVRGFAQIPIEDSYAVADALSVRLAELDVVENARLVPSDEVTAMLVVQAIEQQRLAEERQPIEGMSDDESSTETVAPPD